MEQQPEMLSGWDECVRCLWKANRQTWAWSSQRRGRRRTRALKRVPENRRLKEHTWPQPVRPQAQNKLRQPLSQWVRFWHGDAPGEHFGDKKQILLLTWLCRAVNLHLEENTIASALLCLFYFGSSWNLLWMFYPMKHPHSPFPLGSC